MSEEFIITLHCVKRPQDELWAEPYNKNILIGIQESAQTHHPATAYVILTPADTQKLVDSLSAYLAAQKESAHEQQ